MKRKKVFIICAKEEYEDVWKNLHSIVDLKTEELLVPYHIMLSKYIDKHLLEEIDENISHSDKMTLINEIFNKRKLNYFYKTAPQVDEIIIVKNGICDLSNYSLEEKKQEVEWAEKAQKKFRYFDFNLEIKKPLVK